MRLLIRLIPIALFFIYAAYYYITHQSTVPITGRIHLVELSKQDEINLGIESYQKILSQSQIIEKGQLVEQVRKIGQRIVKVSDVPYLNWEFTVIQSDKVNAFALPGGKVAVYTGITPLAENVNGMATILGHEIAHVIARHGAERLAYEKLKRLGMFAVNLSTGDMDTETKTIIMSAFGLGHYFGMRLPFSRQHETEADYIGLIYMSRACFDPHAAPKFWERMAAASSRQDLAFTSTHPSHKTRIAQLRQWMPEALAIREQYCGSINNES